MISGCMQFLYPITENEEEKSVDPLLYGSWMDKDKEAIYKIEAGNASNTMRITCVFKGKKSVGDAEANETTIFSAFLFKHENETWLDLQNEALDREKKDLLSGLIPTHFYFLVVEHSASKLVLAAPDFKKMKDLLDDNPDFLKHELVEKDQLLITERGAGFQQKFLKSGKWKDVYSEKETFMKIKP